MKSRCSRIDTHLLKRASVEGAELELLAERRLVDGEHDGLPLVVVRQAEHVADLVHGDPQEVDAVRLVVLDLVVLVVVEVHAQADLRVRDLAAAAVERTVAVEVDACKKRRRTCLNLKLPMTSVSSFTSG